MSDSAHEFLGRYAAVLLLLSIGIIMYLLARPCQVKIVSSRSSLSVYGGQYGEESLLKLKGFRSQLWPTTEEIYSQIVLGKLEGPHVGYRPFNTFLSCPPGQKLQRFGSGEDGGKFMCGPLHLQPECVVVSMGSFGEFSFEESMLNNTDCQIHTFDCTYDGKPLDPQRHHYHKICVGSAEHEKNYQNMFTYKNALKKAGVHRVDILKIDIELFEAEAFSTWQEGDPDLFLPSQIAVELHQQDMMYGDMSYMNLKEGVERTREVQTHMWDRQNFTVPEIALFFGHMANMGYGIVSKEENPDCAYCCEYTLLLVERRL